MAWTRVDPDSFFAPIFLPNTLEVLSHSVGGQPDKKDALANVRALGSCMRRKEQQQLARALVE